MNILFLSTESPFPLDHGHHLRIYQNLKALAKRHRIFFLAFSREPQALNDAAELKKLCASVDIIPLPQGKWRWRMYASMFANLFSPEAYTIRRYVSREAKGKIQQILAAHAIDVVHFDLFHLAGYLSEVKALPKILVAHNIESLRMRRWARVERNYLLKLFLYYQYAKLYRSEARLCPKFEKCIAVSDFDKQMLVGICGHDNFTVVPNGVDCDYFRPGNHYDETNGGLVWIGSMQGAYNHDAVDYFLKRIAPIIHAKMPGVNISFVGASPTRLLQEQARTNAKITFTGYVDDVRPFVDRAAVFIAPIRSGSGTKVKILNAMAQAKAVVTTSIGAEGIAALPDKEILIADDEHDFAAKVMVLLQDPLRAREIGRQARRLIEQRYDWRIVNKIMNDIYEQLISKQSEMSQGADPATAL